MYVSGVSSSALFSRIAASTISPLNFARGEAVANFFANRAATSKPTLCRVSLYFPPGLPRPTINFTFAASNCGQAAVLRRPIAIRSHLALSQSKRLFLLLRLVLGCLLLADQLG